MLTEGLEAGTGLEAGEYTEVTLPGGNICRMYKADGRVECKGPGEEVFTPRGKSTPELGSPLPPLDIRF